MPLPAAVPGAATASARAPALARARAPALARARAPARGRALAGRLACGGSLVLAGTGALAGCAAGGPAGQVGGPAAAHVVTAPLAGRQRAELDVMSGATSITVGTGRVGGDLLRVSTPTGSGIKPSLVTGGTVELYLASTGTNGPAAVQVTLNSGVAWRLAFNGGSTRTAVFLGRGQLSGADFTAGSSRITMRLPRPRGTVTIVLAGGASQVSIATPAGVPARLRLYGGAAVATLGDRTYTGIAGGTVLAAPGWASAANRYDIEATAGVSVISAGLWSP